MAKFKKGDICIVKDACKSAMINDPQHDWLDDIGMIVEIDGPDTFSGKGWYIGTMYDSELREATRLYFHVSELEKIDHI